MCVCCVNRTCRKKGAVPGDAHRRGKNGGGGGGNVTITHKSPNNDRLTENINGDRF